MTVDDFLYAVQDSVVIISNSIVKSTVLSIAVVADIVTAPFLAPLVCRDTMSAEGTASTRPVLFTNTRYVWSWDIDKIWQTGDTAERYMHRL